MKKKSNEIVRALAMVTQLGVSMLAPVILCVVVGNWLDARFNWSVTVVLLILGILAGARNTWILMKQEIGTDGKRRQDHEHKENK